MSMLLAGLIVEYAGYQAAFLSLSAVAAVALLIFWALMPETKEFATAGREVDDFEPGVLRHRLGAVKVRNLPVSN